MGARTLNNLTDRGVKALREAGWHADGGGLYMRVLKAAKPDAPAPKRWVFVFQWPPGAKDAKRTEMGMGSYPDVSLSDARDGLFGRAWAREQLKAGLNPIEERRRLREEAAAPPPPAAVTFSAWAAEIAPTAGPKAAKAAKAWLGRMQGKVGAMAQKPPAEVTTEDVLAALKPYWTSRPETGRKLRMGIEAVLDGAKAKGLIQDPWLNPARWRGHLAHLLPKPSKKVQHHKAIPYRDLPAFMAALREKGGTGARALEWTILTCIRTSETIYAVEREVDRKAKLWIIPAERMKGDDDTAREHRVPLTDAALDVLDRTKAAQEESGTDYLFPSTFRPGKPLSTAAMERVLHDMGYKGIATVHGMRSAFKDWATDCTNFANEVSEAALAHVSGDETERAYRRTDALLKRTKLMEAWAGYLAPRADNVRALGDVRRGR